MKIIYHLQEQALLEIIPQELELPLALEHFLMTSKQIKEIILHLDNDRAGYETAEKIKYHLDERYVIIDRRLRRYKDINDLLLKYYRSNYSLIK